MVDSGNLLWEWEKEGSSFSRAMPIFSATGGFLLITLSAPRTKSFLNMDSRRQKIKYRHLFEQIVHTFIGFEILDTEFKFEYTARSAVHLHGYIRFTDDSYHCPIGAVTDAVKAYLLCLTKKYSNFSEANVYPDLIRYRCPSICVQYLFKDDLVGFERWLRYINKEQLDIDQIDIKSKLDIISITNTDDRIRFE